MMFLIAQAQAAQPAPTTATDYTQYVWYAVAAVVAWIVKNRLGISIPLIDKPSGPAVPLPVPSTPTTNRPILDWMAAELIARYGKNEVLKTAILEEVDALKKTLDAAGVPSLGEKVDPK